MNDEGEIKHMPPTRGPAFPSIILGGSALSAAALGASVLLGDLLRELLRQVGPLLALVLLSLAILTFALRLAAERRRGGARPARPHVTRLTMVRRHFGLALLGALLLLGAARILAGLAGSAWAAPLTDALVFAIAGGFLLVDLPLHVIDNLIIVGRSRRRSAAAD